MTTDTAPRSNDNTGHDPQEAENRCPAVTGPVPDHGQVTSTSKQSKPKPKVFKPLKKRHTTPSSSVSVASLLATSSTSQKPAAALRQRQATLLQYSTDPRQRHDATVDVIPEGVLRPLAPASSSRRSAPSSSRRSANDASGQAHRLQRKLTEFGVCRPKPRQGESEKRPIDPLSPSAANSGEHDMRVIHGQERPWSADHEDENKAAPDQAHATADHDTGQDATDDGTCAAFVEQAAGDSEPSERQPPPDPHLQPTGSMYLADLPAAPQYFAILPRLPLYTPPVPSSSSPAPGANPSTSDEQPPAGSPYAAEAIIAKVSSAQQQIDQARAERRPVTLTLLVDVWREKLALQQLEKRRE